MQAVRVQKYGPSHSYAAGIRGLKTEVPIGEPIYIT